MREVPNEVSLGALLIFPFAAKCIKIGDDPFGEVGMEQPGNTIHTSGHVRNHLKNPGIQYGNATFGKISMDLSAVHA